MPAMFGLKVYDDNNQVGPMPAMFGLKVYDHNNQVGPMPTTTK